MLVQELRPVCHTDGRCQQEKLTEEYMENTLIFFVNLKLLKKNKTYVLKIKKSQWDIFEGVGGGKKEKLSTLKFTWNDTWMMTDKFSIYD